MTGRYENTDKYDPEDWELKINIESDENRRVWGPTQQLRSEAAAARRTSNTITTEQVNEILQGKRNRRWTEFHNRMLAQEQQECERVCYKMGLPTTANMLCILEDSLSVKLSTCTVTSCN